VILTDVIKHIRSMQRRFDLLLIEGAGGLSPSAAARSAFVLMSLGAGQRPPAGPGRRHRELIIGN